jgi:hypothetical protein
VFLEVIPDLQILLLLRITLTPVHDKTSFTSKMRLVALTAPFLNVALYLVGTTELVSSLPADSSDTITLRKCVDFMGGYAGSWFAKDAMFKDVKWPDRVRTSHFIFL